MNKAVYLAIVGGAAYLLFLILTFPARVAFDWLVPDSMVALGVEGTIWRGKARTLVINEVAFSSAKWRFTPTALLALSVGYEVEAERSDGFVRARVNKGLFGDMAIRDLQAALPLASLEQALPLSGASGNLSARLDTVRLQNDWPVVLNGQINLNQLIVNAPNRQALGSYLLAFDNQRSDPITGRFSDIEGPLQVEGVLTLRSDRTYFVEGHAAPRPDANDDLRNMLRFLGPPDAGRGHPFSLEGNL